MSEFLKNLRSNQSAYSNGNRKGQDSYYHPNRERRGDSRRTENRRKYTKEPQVQKNPFSEVMPLFKEVLPKIVETFERIAISREKQIQAEERKTDALEQITVSLTKLIASQSFNVTSQGINVNPQGIRDNNVDEDEDGNYLKMDKDSAHRTAEENRKRVVEIIQKMRDENYTYDHIAHYLTEHQFPTFSHRGDWHAQTVHRLFRKGSDQD